MDMEISCREVVREISNYVDGGVEVALRESIAAHLAGCKHCTAVLDGTRNLIRLVGDGRSFILPAGFSRRLQARLSKG